MTLSETMLLLTLLIAAAALILDVAKAAFDIAWKISHDRKDDDNKKIDRLSVPSLTVNLF